MAVFRSREQARAVFTSLFEALLKDPAFVARVTEAELSLRMIQSSPDLRIHVCPIGIYLDEATDGVPAVVTVRMSGDTAHRICSGTMPLPLAIATGRVWTQGRIAKLRQLAPLLHPVRDRYPAIAAEAGVAA